MLGIVSMGDVTIMDNAATTFNLMGFVVQPNRGIGSYRLQFEKCRRA